MILLIFFTSLSTWNMEVRAIVKDLDQVNNADSAFIFLLINKMVKLASLVKMSTDRLEWWHMIYFRKCVNVMVKNVMSWKWGPDHDDHHIMWHQGDEQKLPSWYAFRKYTVFIV